MVSSPIPGDAIERAPSPEPPPVLAATGLCKRYGDRPVLDGLSFCVRAGEIYGLLGPNGAGKTTALNLLGHLLEPDGGRAEIEGIPVSDATKARIGIAPQDNLLYGTLTCAENLDFFARLYGLPAADRRDRVRACLEFVNLSDRARSPAETLSGGMQRRLNLAIALVHDPPLVVLDEPTVGLDLEARHDLWAAIRALRDRGTAILLTTHLLDEAERLCDRLGILKGGRLAAEGTLADLRSRVAAAELVRVQTGDRDGAIARAEALGWPWRVQGNELIFWLPEALEFPEILARLEGLPLEALARQPVGLEQVYLEVTQGRAIAAS